MIFPESTRFSRWRAAHDDDGGDAIGENWVYTKLIEYSEATRQPIYKASCCTVGKKTKCYVRDEGYSSRLDLSWYKLYLYTTWILSHVTFQAKHV